MHDTSLTALEAASAGLDHTWAIEGLCAQTDPELFFPEKESGKNSAAAAKRVCMACPVRARCLTEALARNEQFGVWGGLTFTERRQLRRGRAVAA